MKLAYINEGHKRIGSTGPNGPNTGITQYVHDLNKQGKLSPQDRSILSFNPHKKQYKYNERGRSRGDMDNLRDRHKNHVDIVDQSDFDRDVHDRIMDFVERDLLTPQQGAVINQMAYGLTIKEIAEKLGLSPTRVSQHIKVALPKFKKAWIQWKNTELPPEEQIS